MFNLLHNLLILEMLLTFSLMQKKVETEQTNYLSPSVEAVVHSFDEEAIDVNQLHNFLFSEETDELVSHFPDLSEERSVIEGPISTTRQKKGILFAFIGVFINIEKRQKLETMKDYVESRTQLKKALRSFENGNFTLYDDVEPEYVSLCGVVHQKNNCFGSQNQIVDRAITLLDEANYKIAILANTGFLEENLKIPEIKKDERYEIIESSVIKETLPEKEFFKKVTEVLGLSAEELVLIDESDENVKNARLVGIDSIMIEDGDLVSAMKNLGSIL
ncbi:hypothetical protein Mgra_00007046, partial [Meloidogyne graminicola]